MLMGPCGNCLGLFDRPSPGYSRGYPGSVYDCYCSNEEQERQVHEKKLMMALITYKNRVNTLPDDKEIPSLKSKFEEASAKYKENYPGIKANFFRDILNKKRGKIIAEK